MYITLDIAFKMLYILLGIKMSEVKVSEAFEEIDEMSMFPMPLPLMKRIGPSRELSWVICILNFTSDIFYLIFITLPLPLLKLKLYRVRKKNQPQ